MTGRLTTHVGVEMARRLETAEGRLLVEAAALHRRQPGSRAFSLTLGGGVAVGFDSVSPINKVIGAGLDEVTNSDLDRAEAAFTVLGVPAFVEVCPLAHDSLLSNLARRHYRLVAFESALVCALDAAPAPPASPSIQVRDVRPSEMARWARTVAEGFGADPSSDLARTLGTLLGATPRTRCLLAEIDGVHAGGAAVRIEDGVALCFATSTLPRFRGRGVQTALVDASLFAARMADADVATATTQPGSQSQRTFERLGFRVAFTRAILRSFDGEPPRD